LTFQAKIRGTIDFAHTSLAEEFVDRKSADSCSAQDASGRQGGIGLHEVFGHWERPPSPPALSYRYRGLSGSSLRMQTYVSGPVFCHIVLSKRKEVNKS